MTQAPVIFIFFQFSLLVWSWRPNYPTTTHAPCIPAEEYIPANFKPTNETLLVEDLTELNDTIYPNLRCHKGYYSDNGVKSGSEDYLKNLNNECKLQMKENPELCFKQCMFQKLRVVSYKNELSPEIVMAEFLDLAISLLRTHYAGSRLARQIVGRCMDKYKAVKDKHCRDWTIFYDCVENVWKCNVYVHRFKRRSYRRVVYKQDCLISSDD